MSGRLSESRLLFLFFVLTSLLSLGWYRFKPIVFWDGGLPFTSLTRTKLGELYSLVRYGLEGVNPHLYPPQPTIQSSLVYTLELNALHMVFPMWASQFISTYILLLVGQLGVYKCASWLSAKIGVRPPLWAAVLASAFYVYSPMYQFVLGDGSITYVNVWCTYPAMLYLLLALTDKWGRWADYFKLLLALLALGALASVDYSYFEYVGENLALIVGMVVLVSSYAGVRRLGATLLGFGTLQASYAYFLWRDVIIAPSVAGQGAPPLVSAYHSYFNYASSFNSYLNQLANYYWPVGQPGYPMLPNVPPITVSPLYGLLVLVCCTLPILLASSKMRLIPIYILLVSFVGLAAGSNPPFSAAANTLYTHFWVYRALTEPFLAVGFGVTFTLSVLLVFGLTHLSKRVELRGRAQPAAALLLVGVLVSSIFLMLPYAVGAPSPILPLFSSYNGDITYTVHRVTPRISVPNYYYSLVEYLNTLPERGAVLILPIEGNLYTSTWYVGVDMLSELLNKPVITGGYLDEYPALVDAVYEWSLGYPTNITRILAESGVGYILLQGDVTYGDFMSETPYYNMSYIEGRLNTTPGIQRLAVIGPDIVYGVRAEESHWSTSGDAGTSVSPPSGFAVYPLSQVEEVNPTPGHPYRALFNLTAYTENGEPTLTRIKTTGCVDATLSSKWEPINHGVEISVTPSCPTAGGVGFTATISIPLELNKPNTTIYLSYAYNLTTTGSNTTVTLNSPAHTYNPLQLASPQGWVYYAYPAANYTSLTITLGGLILSGHPVNYTLRDLYVSLGVDTQTLLTSIPGVYLWSPNKTLDSTAVGDSPPTLGSWSCSVLECSLSLKASSPFLLVWYTPYSQGYTLSVDGTTDRAHLEALGVFNAWIVNKTGTLNIRAKWVNPNEPWDIFTGTIWVILLSIFVTTGIRARKKPSVGGRGHIVGQGI